MTLSLADKEAITVVIILAILGISAYISYRLTLYATATQEQQPQEPLLSDDTESVV